MLEYTTLVVPKTNALHTELNDLASKGFEAVYFDQRPNGTWIVVAKREKTDCEETPVNKD